MKSKRLLFICFFCLVPRIFYLNTLAGLGATPRNLGGRETLPALAAHAHTGTVPVVLAPFLESALSLSVGVSFKAERFAELIGQPLLSFGNGLYRAKFTWKPERCLPGHSALCLLRCSPKKSLSLLLRALISACAK